MGTYSTRIELPKHEHADGIAKNNERYVLEGGREGGIGVIEALIVHHHLNLPLHNR
jgi:hypothetical protein